MKQQDFKVTERISRPAVKVVCMQFGDNEVLRCIGLYHKKCVILQYKEEIQKLTYK